MLKQAVRPASILLFCFLFAVTVWSAFAGSNADASEGRQTSSMPGHPVAEPLEKPLALPPAPVAALAPAAVVMSENFEGSWPKSGWYLSDQSSNDGGEYLLGRRACHPHGGSYGGWTVGGGAQGAQLSCSATYPNNAYSVAEYGPLNLSSASSASLSFYFWGAAEGSNDGCLDGLIVADGLQGESYDHGTIFCGDWTTGDRTNGYSKATLDLSGRLGAAAVWVVFGFASDESVTDIGFTVDDISLDVTTAGATATPTTRPTATVTPRVTPTKTPTPGTIRAKVRLPLIVNSYVTRPCANDPYEPNGAFQTAWGPLPVNQDFYGYFNCTSDTDRDYYYFDLSSTSHVTITLDDVPAGSDYDLTLYSCAAATCLVKHSGNPNNGSEKISVDIGAGRYYVRVVRSQASPLVSQPYRLRVAIP